MTAKPKTRGARYTLVVGAIYGLLVAGAIAMGVSAHGWGFLLGVGIAPIPIFLLSAALDWAERGDDA